MLDKLKYFSIDRFEGDFAICILDDEEILKIERKKLPKNCKEGDVLKKTGEFYEIDLKETKKRKEELYNLQNELFDEN